MDNSNKIINISIFSMQDLEDGQISVCSKSILYSGNYSKRKDMFNSKINIVNSSLSGTRTVTTRNAYIWTKKSGQ